MVILRGPEDELLKLDHILMLNEAVYKEYFLTFTLADVTVEEEGEEVLDVSKALGRWAKRFEGSPEYIFTTDKPPWLWLGPVPGARESAAAKRKEANDGQK